MRNQLSVAALLAASGLLLATLSLASNSETEDSAPLQLTLEDLQTFTLVFDQIRRHYVEEISETRLLQAAIDGMLMETDGNSLFLDPSQSRESRSKMAGKEVGISAEINVVNGRLILGEVLPGSSAYSAGLRSGDVITAVDDAPVRGRLITDSLAAIRGKLGTEVSLTLARSGHRLENILVRREWAPMRSVDSQWFDPGVAYFSISHFHDLTDEEFSARADALMEAQSAPLQGVILDLRHNGGGSIRAAVQVADEFLEHGPIVSTNSRYPATQMKFTANPGQKFPGTRVALLLNGETASAAELLAAALQDRGRARLFGQKSFGKGSIQTVHDLPNGSSLKITTARYITPSGHGVDAEGVEPDVPVSSEKDPLEVATSWLLEGFDFPNKRRSSN